jgi:hypothetical protein
VSERRPGDDYLWVRASAVRHVQLEGDVHAPLAGVWMVAKGKKVPVAIGFMLAEPTTALGRVPPHSARDLDRPALQNGH